MAPRKKKFAALLRRGKRRRRVAAAYLLLRVSVIATLVRQIFIGNYENMLLCLLTMVLLLLPSLFSRQLNIELPDTLEIIILLFIYAAEVLGEISAFYTHFPYWDTTLHTVNGFLCAAIGFALVDILNREKRVSISLSPLSMAVVAFCFSMTVGVLWEFFEFAMDQLLRFDMQKDTILNRISTVMLDPSGGTSPVGIDGIQDVILVLADGTEISLGLGGYLDVGLHDTIQDLFVNFIGAVVFSVVGYFHVKNRGEGGFAPQFIPRVLDQEEIQRREAGEAAPAEKENPENSGGDE